MIALKRYAVDLIKNELFRQFAVNFFLKIIGVLFGFLVTFIVARHVEISIAGEFFLCMSICFIVGTVFKFGLDQATIRFVSVSNLKNHGHLDVMRSVLLISGIFTSIISLLCFVVVSFFPFIDMSIDILILIFINSAFWAFFNLIAMGFQGLSFNKTSVIFLNILSNFVFLLLFFLFRPDTLISLLQILLFSSFFCFLSSYFVYFKNSSFFQYNTINFKILRSSVLLFLVSICGQFLFWGGQLFIGLFEPSESVAVFAVCQRLSMLVSFVLTTINFILAPQIAKNATSGDFRKIEFLCRRGILITLSVSLPIFIIIFLFPELLLSVFGGEYRQGKVSLLILIVGQAINVMFGPVIYILSMSGYEKDLAKCSLFAGVTLAASSLLLVDVYGINGAAISTVLAIFVQTFTASVFVKLRLNICFYRLSK